MLGAGTKSSSARATVKRGAELSTDHHLDGKAGCSSGENLGRGRSLVRPWSKTTDRLQRGSGKPSASSGEEGVGIVAECFALSKKVETQKTARALLESLAHGNPKFQIQVYKALIGLLSCTSPNGQCLVLQTLHGIQATIKPADQSVVEPLLNLLRSLHPQVQIEAFELISELKHYEVRPALLKSLVELLKSPKQDVQRHKILQGPEMSKMTEPLPVFVQQAAAAKVIRNLAQSGEEISNELLTLGVVHHLLYAMGKQGHADTQRQASLALEYFVRTYPKVEEHAHRCMGAALFESFMCNPEDIYMKIDASQAEILQSNDVNISDVEKVSFINNE
ncbi:armadillo-like helical domain containing protein 1 isoform X6 [Denticeps clupeoides]|uniref:armadillo-like helical domain containing protein 1 isoform X6 n=1 Tax=Denticeps clupeoides TaxID=299321 RepID=UPI0010A2BFF5|nr:armadillo-like helical domain containing protein 1 isoform X6 [Denticeps clupeoides]